jgi:hypothetical protein
LKKVKNSQNCRFFEMPKRGKSFAAKVLPAIHSCGTFPRRARNPIVRKQDFPELGTGAAEGEKIPQA